MFLHAVDYDRVYIQFFPVFRRVIYITFFAPNDQISLEYDDVAQLRFTIDDELVDYGDDSCIFIVPNCTVYIIDNDREFIPQAT